mgnify:CR=1 FL=1
MKKQALLILPILLGISGCTLGGGETKAYGFKSHVEKRVQMYDAYYGTVRKGKEIKMHFFDNVDVPYISIREYFKKFMNLGNIASQYSFDFDENKLITTITNDTYNTSAVIDFNKQTITYDDFTSFVNIYNKSIGQPLTTLTSGGGSLFHVSNYHYQAPKSKLVVKLNDYHMHAYYDKDKENGYLPFQACENFFIPEYSTDSYVYGDEKLINCYSYYYEDSTAQAVAREFGDYEFSKSYMDFTYYLTALSLDLRFGLDERFMRSTNSTHEFLPEGAIKALESRYDKLTSTKAGVYDKAINDFYLNEMDDGGHTAFTRRSFLDPNKTANISYGPEYSYTMKNYYNLYYSRYYAGYNPESHTGSDQEYSEYGDIAFLTFDSFNLQENSYNYSYVNEDNYYKDTITLTMYADKMIKQHNIKDVVIDLSLNGGGVALTLSFIASWLCGGFTSYLYDGVSGAFASSYVEADINTDGRITSDDFIDPDINVYVIVTGNSFSCGNALPTLLQDNKENVYYIGSRSGGGACVVDDGADTGLGTTLRLSGRQRICREGSTQDNPISNDGGVTAMFYPITESNTNAFYDRDEIAARIIANRK